MKKKCFLLLLVVMISALTCAMAENGNAVIFYEDTAIESIVGFNGSLYMMRYEGLIQYLPDEKTEAVIDDSISSQWDSPQQIHYLLVSNHELYGFSATDKVLLKLINSAGVYVKEKVFESESMKEYDWVHPIMIGGKLIYITETSDFSAEGNRQELHEVDIETGAETVVTVKGIRFLEAYKDNQVIALTEGRSQGILKSFLTTIDRQTGEQTILWELESGLKLSALAYDMDTDRLYAADSSQIYLFQAEQGFVPQTSIMRGDVGHMAVIAKELVAVVSDQSLIISNVNTQNTIGKKTLTLQEPVGRGESYKSYISAHPDVTMVFGGDASRTNEEQFIQDVLTKNADIDIYILSDKNMIKTIYDKEYGVDLSSSDAISALVNDMYGPFKSTLLRNGKIFAFPRRSFVEMLGYNPDFFEAFNFMVPTTYDELLDLTVMWLDEYAADYPEVYFDPFVNGVNLVTLLERYADEMAKNGKDIVYSKVTLHTTIQKLLSTRARYQAEMESYGGEYETYAFNIVDVLQTGGYRCLPLAFEADNQPVISGTDIAFSYFVINPNSKNAEQAIAFLESYEADREDIETATLYQSQNTAVKNATFDKELMTRQVQIDDLSQMLAVASPDEINEIEVKIALAKDNLEAFVKEAQWRIPQHAIDQYQIFANNIYISDLNPLALVSDELGALINRLETGNLDVTRFTREIDLVVQAIYMEAY